SKVEERRVVLHRWTPAALAVSLAFAISATATAHAASAVSVDGLRLDNRTDPPLGVDDAMPTLSWKLAGSGASARQSAYEVKVSAANGSLLWDSGRVAGA